ncbi:hypothetical protein EYF80_049159 [Liparis tanakae]|uniref:Uncharacterized protein n=1 Tax=Liparis tanakae TaxID=230148 RepID=A0A4Z2FI93_9TELE|nr:hypothetical protein EYF80_049159 [Liparis tanakae]
MEPLMTVSVMLRCSQEAVSSSALGLPQSLAEVELEKSAQPVAALEGAGGVAGAALHDASSESSVEEGGEEDAAAGAAGAVGLDAGAVDVPVSMGMSSKLAVHTGPKR